MRKHALYLFICSIIISSIFLIFYYPKKEIPKSSVDHHSMRLAAPMDTTTTWLELGESEWQAGTRVSIQSFTPLEYIKSDTEDGTESLPYLIDNESELAVFLYELSSGCNNHAGIYFKINNDLNLEQYYLRKNSTDDEITFSGKLDGNQHTISNLYIDNQNLTNNTGIFSQIYSSTSESTAMVQNLTITNATIRSQSDNTGILAGKIGDNVTLNQVIVKNSTIDSSSNSVGGIAGDAVASLSASQLTIQNCEVHSTSIKGKNDVGGILGKFNTNADTITSLSHFNITSCLSSKNDILGDLRVGGIVGSFYGYFEKCNATVGQCYNYSKVSANLYCAGGIVGGLCTNTDNELFQCEDTLQFTITECGNSGDISGNNYASGICGLVYSAKPQANNTISYCFNQGKITIFENFEANTSAIVGDPQYYYPLEYDGGYIVSAIVFSTSNVYTTGICHPTNCYNTGTLILPDWDGLKCIANGDNENIFSLSQEAGEYQYLYPEINDPTYLSEEEMRLTASSEKNQLDSTKFTTTTGYPKLNSIPDGWYYRPTITINKQFSGIPTSGTVWLGTPVPNIDIDYSYFPDFSYDDDYEVKFYSSNPFPILPNTELTENDIILKDQDIYPIYKFPIEITGNGTTTTIYIWQLSNLELTDLQNIEIIQKDGYTISGVDSYTLPLFIQNPTSLTVTYSVKQYTVTAIDLNGQSHQNSYEYGTVINEADYSNLTGCDGKQIGDQYFLNWYNSLDETKANVFVDGSYTIVDDITLQVHSERISATSITLVSTNHQKEYACTEALNVTNLQIGITYNHPSDETPETLAVTQEMVSNFTTEALGSFNATITYDGQTTDYPYQVTTCHHTTSTIQPTCSTSAMCSICGEEIPPTGQHTLGEWIAEIPATCTETGSKAHYTCSVCGKHFDQDEQTEINITLAIDETNHSYGEWTSNHNDTHSARCQYDNTHILTETCSGGNPDCCHKALCDICNEEYGVFGPHRTEFIAPITPTCSTPGNRGYWHCSVCNHYFEDEIGTIEIAENSWILPAAHQFSSLVEQKDPTCTEDGYVAHYNCLYCEKHFDINYVEINDQEYILPASHNYDTWKDEIPATCIADGTKGYYLCLSCSKYFDKDGLEITTLTIPLDENSHSYTIWEQNSDGTTHTSHCDNDGSHLITENCTGGQADCSHKAICEKCNKEYGQFGNHQLLKTEAKEATCTQEGNTEYWTCSICNKYYSNKDATREIAENSWIIEKINHSGGHADCTQKAICEVCKQEYGDYGDHTLSHHPATPKACDTDGNKEYWSCSICHNYFADENATQVIEKDSWIIVASHNVGEWIDPINPTCTEDGSVGHYICSDCHHYLNEQKEILESIIINKIGHRYENWTSNSDGTHTGTCHNDATHTITENCTGGHADCTQKAICEVCQAEYGDYGNHTLTHHLATPKTCDTDGNSEYWSCSICLKYYNDENASLEIEKKNWFIPASHEFSDWKDEIPATCSSIGTKGHYTCLACNKNFDSNYIELTELNLPINQDNHLYENWTSNSDGTHTGTCHYDATHTITENCSGGQADCTQKAICEVCHTEYGNLGHHTLTHHPATPKTCDTDGNKEYWSCSNCNKYYNDENATLEIEKQDWLIPASHEFSEWIDEIPATCSSAGTKGHYTCLACEKSFDADYIEIADLSISFDNTNHTSLTYQSNGDGTHKHYCTSCQTILEGAEACSGGTSSCTQKAICEKCHEEYGELLNHEVDDHGWYSNETDHWHQCKNCHEIMETEPHTYKWVIDVAATIEAEGFKHKECLCGDIIEENTPIPMLTCSHQLIKTEAKEATCTQKGNIEYWTCSICHNYYSDENGNLEIEEYDWIIPITHQYSWQKEIPATCLMNGIVGHYTCLACNKNFDSNYIELTELSLPINDNNHSYGDWISINPGTHTAFCNYSTSHTITENCSGGHANCTQKAICEVCHTEYGSLGDHTLTQHPATPKTCDTDGNKEYWSCSNCNKYYNDENATLEIEKQDWLIPASHEFSEWIDEIPATCSSAGTKGHYTCLACEKSFNADYIEIADLSISLDNTNHTSLTYQSNGDGTHKHYCTSCQTILEGAEACSGGTSSCTQKATCEICHTEYGLFGNHQLLKTEAKKATCTQEGNAEYWTCSICHKYYADEAATTEMEKDSWIIEILDHSGGHADCSHKAICEVCQAEYGEYGSHQLSKTEAKEATCTQEGSKEYWTCSICHKYYADEAATTEMEKDSWIIKILDHSGGHADCSHKAICEVCQAEYGEYGSHQLSKTEAKEATCTQEGNTEYWSCTICQKYYSNQEASLEIEKDSWIVPTSHHFSDSWSIDETKHWHKCDNLNCDAITNVESHTWNVDQATTEVDKHCTVCGYVAENIISHTHQLTHVASKEPSCTESGNLEYWKCDCGQYFSDSEAKTIIEQSSVLIPATGHAYTDDTDSTCNNCNEERTIPTQSPTTPETEKKGLGTGAIVGISVGSVTALGCAAGIIILSILKRKKKL